MPRPKRKHTNRKDKSTLKKDDSLNLTLMDVDSKLIEDGNFKVEMWKAQVKDKMKDAFSKISEKQKEVEESLELYFNNLLMGMKKTQLNIPINIDDEKFRLFILSVYDNAVDANTEECESIPSPAYQVRQSVKRRSRSVNTIKKVSTRSSRLRSTSVDVYKTPKGRVRLSSIMTNKKYTVMKPAKAINSGLNVKRIMKPDEMAISTCGSPLYVASSSLAAPHVNIPLPGGVVLNIEPKEPEGPVDIPSLDAKTKSQLKTLCEQLKKLI